MKMLRRNRILILAMAVLLILALAACAKAEAPPTEAPQEPQVEPTEPAEPMEEPTEVPAKPFEGQVLRLITWEGYVPDEVKEAFEAETGATVEITYISDNGELISKLRATGGTGWDLAQPSVDNVAGAQELYGIYQPIDISRIPNFANAIDSLEARVAEYSTVGGERYSIPFTWGTSGLIVNTAKVEEEVNSYRQLCDPKYKGRVTYRYRYPTFAGAAYGLGHDLFAAANDPVKWREIMEETLEYLIACKDNVKAYWTTRQENIDLMLKEEAWIAQGWDGTGWLLSRENPAIKFIAPKEGALGWVDTYTIPSGAENIDLAYAWIEFNYRPEIAGKVIAGGGFLSAIEGAVDLLSEDQAALINESFPPEAIDNINWYPPVTPEIDDINAEMVEKLRAALGIEE
jgi:spermidine/putrescine transport system substrate-binding protein